MLSCAFGLFPIVKTEVHFLGRQESFNLFPISLCCFKNHYMLSHTTAVAKHVCNYHWLYVKMNDMRAPQSQMISNNPNLPLVVGCSMAYKSYPPHLYQTAFGPSCSHHASFLQFQLSSAPKLLGGNLIPQLRLQMAPPAKDGGTRTLGILDSLLCSGGVETCHPSLFMLTFSS